MEENVVRFAEDEIGNSQEPVAGKTRVIYSSRRHRRVLIIDDDEDTAEAIKYTVESYNRSFQCVVTSDPYEALLNMTDRRFDFVLVDQRIPGLKGSSILKKLDGFIDSDPLLNDSNNYREPISIVIMSGAGPLNPSDLHLKNFKTIKFLDKRELPGYLSETFERRLPTYY